VFMTVHEDATVRCWTAWRDEDRRDNPDSSELLRTLALPDGERPDRIAYHQPDQLFFFDERDREIQRMRFSGETLEPLRHNRDRFADIDAESGRFATATSGGNVVFCNDGEMTLAANWGRRPTTCFAAYYDTAFGYSDRAETLYQVRVDALGRAAESHETEIEVEGEVTAMGLAIADENSCVMVGTDEGEVLWYTRQLEPTGFELKIDAAIRYVFPYSSFDQAFVIDDQDRIHRWQTTVPAAPLELDEELPDDWVFVRAENEDDSHQLVSLDAGTRVDVGRQLDDAEPSREGLCLAQQNGQWGIFDRAGNWIVPPRLPRDRIKLLAGEAYAVRGEEGYLVFRLNGTRRYREPARFVFPYVDGWSLLANEQSFLFGSLDNRVVLPPSGTRWVDASCPIDGHAVALTQRGVAYLIDLEANQSRRLMGGIEKVSRDGATGDGLAMVETDESIVYFNYDGEQLHEARSATNPTHSQRGIHFRADIGDDRLLRYYAYNKELERLPVDEAENGFAAVMPTTNGTIALARVPNGLGVLLLANMNWLYPPTFRDYERPWGESSYTHSNPFRYGTRAVLIRDEYDRQVWLIDNGRLIPATR